MSLNIVVGYCGLMTASHASYFAIGSYTYALATLVLGWSFFPAIFLGVTLAAVLSLAISLPALRLKGDFFFMVSLAIQALIFNAIYNWSAPDAPLGSWKNLTNGSFGIPGVPKPDIFGIRLGTIGSIALTALFISGGCLLIGKILLGSPWGRVLQAMRDEELAARGLGKNVRCLKVGAFAIACGMVAVAGAIYASYASFVDPSIASLDQSILMLSMVIIGGMGNFRGPLVGAFVLLAIPEILRFANIPPTVGAELRLMAYGLLLVVMIHLRPQGLAGSYRIE